MSEQPLPGEPVEGTAFRHAEDPLPAKRQPNGPQGEYAGNTRRGYRRPGGSESTRELRDTARRRRDAEEKLQQHLIEAKNHVPNEHHDQDGAKHHGA